MFTLIWFFVWLFNSNPDFINTGDNTWLGWLIVAGAIDLLGAQAKS